MTDMVYALGLKVDGVYFTVEGPYSTKEDALEEKALHDKSTDLHVLHLQRSTFYRANVWKR